MGSTFSALNKLSIGALSQALALLLKDMVMPRSRRDTPSRRPTWLTARVAPNLRDWQNSEQDQQLCELLTADQLCSGVLTQ